MTPSQQLNQKLALENQLIKELGVYNRSLVREFIRQLGTAAVTLDPEERNEELTELLEAHYQRTATIFTPVIPGKLPADVAITEQEGNAVALALATVFGAHAIEAAREINRTTAREATAAVAAAQATTETIQETAAVAGAQLNRNLKGRVSTIAATETQFAAEGSKSVTGDVLLGRQPSLTGGRGQPTVVTKEWWTVGDNLVREPHLVADGQEVPENEPFIVDGEALRFPGDTSLGASLDNVINCRCIAEYNAAEIAEERRARL